jgi:hypothetical protein
MERISQRKVIRKVKKESNSNYHNISSVSFENAKMILNVDNKEFVFFLKDISKKLLKATVKEREAYQVISSGYGISWPLINEDLSIDGLIKTYKILNS